MIGPVQYARSADDITLAYRIVGDGEVEAIFVPGILSHIELVLEEPSMRRLFERLGGFCRMVLFDRRGQGMSDQLPDEFSIEQETADLLTVLDAAGFERTALVGYTGGAQLACQFAAMYPERTRALVPLRVMP